MSHLLKRVAFYLGTAWAAITLNFFIPRLMPGDPVQSLINKSRGQMSSESIESLYVLFGLDKDDTLLSQYVKYWGQLLRGDLGLSFTNFPSPVSEVIGQALPWTLGLVGVTTVLGFLIGTALGTLAGWRRGSWIDALIPVTTFLSAIPYFWLGLIAISLLTGPDTFLPAANGYDTGLTPGWDWEFAGSALRHSLLPAITVLISSMAGWVLSMRNMMVTVASEDYVTVAHAKGLPARRVMIAYAARNALLPNVSGFALSLGFIVGGTLLVEIVFSYPGLGLILFHGVGAKDYPLLQGIFLIITLSVLLANFVADLAYTLLDPRTRREG